MRGLIRASVLPLLVAVIGLSGCGGGSSGGGGVTLSGTAATGAAMAGATVTIKDSAGTTKVATTTTTGTYDMDVTGLAPPFLVKVVDASGTPTLYSVGTAAGVVNIHPLTDLIIRTWYETQGTDVATAFDAAIPDTPPTPTELAVINQVVQNLVAQFLGLLGNLDSGNFDLISTPFTADSTGFDNFLDHIQVNNGVISIDATGTTATDYRATLVVNANSMDSTLEEDMNNDGTFGVVSQASNPITGSTASVYAGTWSLGYTVTASGGLCGNAVNDTGTLVFVVDDNGNFLLMEPSRPGEPMISGSINANGNLTATVYGDTNNPAGGTCPAGTLAGTMTSALAGTGTFSQGGDTGTLTLTRMTGFAGTWKLSHTTLSVTDTTNCAESAALIGVPQDGGTLVVAADGSFASASENIAGTVSNAGLVSFHYTGSGTCGPGLTGTGTGNFSNAFGTFSSSQHSGIWSLTRQ